MEKIDKSRADHDFFPVKLTSILVALPLLLSPLGAHPIEWTATGSVTQLAAGVFPDVVVGNPVEIAFSYDSGAEVNPLSLVGSFGKAEFYGAVDFKISVKIGSQIWEGSLPNSPRGGGVYSLHSQAYDGSNAANSDPDILTLSISSTDSGTFPTFPYTGIQVAKKMELVFKDTELPRDFLSIHVLPRGGANVSAITEATGVIAAASETIKFSIDLSSITVSEQEPKFPVTLTRTITGIELKWFGEAGVTYQLFESDDMTGWEELSIHEGMGQDIVVPLEPFALHPNKRFYKVVEL